jgi:hypothetical protein
MSIRAIVLAKLVFFMVSSAGLAPAVEWYVDGAVPQPGDGRGWGTAFKTIQQAIDAASEGDTITVAPGTYLENIQFGGKNIVLRSTDPLDPDIVAATIIDGNQAGSVATFSGTESEACILWGFTLRNGRGDRGGGICGGTWEDRTDATIQKNVIIANSADYDGGGLAYCNGIIEANVITENSGGDGGGVLYCDGLIEHNTISGNWAENLGGGLAYCDGTVRNNTISDNSADDGGGLADCAGAVQGNDISYNSAGHGYGGGLFRCQASIQDNTISHNYAAQGGGGLYWCDRTIRNNVITANHAASGGGGGGLAHCDGLIQNNVITENLAFRGGGLYECDGTVEKNTLSGNHAGGLFECDGTVQNNIILRSGLDKAGGGGLAYCDGTIQNNLIVGNAPGLMYCSGTIVNNTIVANQATGYGAAVTRCTGTITNCIIWGNSGSDGCQLTYSSEPAFSCVEHWTGMGAGIIADEPRFVDPGGRDNDPRTYEDNDYRLLPDSPCIDAGINGGLGPADRDIAGMHRIMYGGKNFTVDMGAYEYHINRLKAGPGAGETTVTWSSLGDRSYSIFYSDDLLTWHLADDGVFSAGYTTTSWIDDGSKTGVPPFLVPRRFYRILQNP